MTVHEDIEALRSRAHEIWQAEGCPDGRALEHWLAAARERRRVDDVTQPFHGAPGPRGEAGWLRRMLWHPQPHDGESHRRDALVALG